MRKRITYANVAATLALVFAMSGGAFAAKHYLLSSTKQISPKVLRALKGKTGKTGATGLAGLAGKEGSPGKEGKEGKEGKQGKEGAPGPVNLSPLTEVRGPESETIEFEFFGIKFFFASSIAECPSGSHVVSGGSVIGQSQHATTEFSEALEEKTGWEVFVFYTEKTGSAQAIAYCSAAGSAVQARPRLRPNRQAGIEARLNEEIRRRHLK